MKVKDIMTSPVLSVESESPISQAIQLMLEKRISGLPVLDGQGRLVGIVTEGDFLRRTETGTQLAGKTLSEELRRVVATWLERTSFCGARHC